MGELNLDDKKNKLLYRTKTATREEIFIHLKECDTNFSPPLSKRVNIDEYAKKLSEKSVTFEAWSGSSIVGLLAAYFNDSEHKIGYISNVSVVKDYGRMGIASKLVRRCIKYAKQYKFKEIKLEVHKNSSPAIHLYKKFGFSDSEEKGDFIQMKLSIL